MAVAGYAADDTKRQSLRASVWRISGTSTVGRDGRALLRVSTDGPARCARRVTLSGQAASVAPRAGENRTRKEPQHYIWSAAWRSG